jgi:hypothetical protein
MPEQCRAANGKTQGAADLLREYGGLDTILAALRFPSQAEALPLYRSIATMITSAPLPRLPDHAPTWARFLSLLAGGGLINWPTGLPNRRPP